MLKSTSQVKALSQWTSGCPRGCNAGQNQKAETQKRKSYPSCALLFDFTNASGNQTIKQLLYRHIMVSGF